MKLNKDLTDLLLQYQHQTKQLHDFALELKHGDHEQGLAWMRLASFRDATLMDIVNECLKHLPAPTNKKANGIGKCLGSSKPCKDADFDHRAHQLCMGCGRRVPVPLDAIAFTNSVGSCVKCPKVFK